jgi:undecaprenyl phosphate N,N'-diacetylbacillosamine 1-phosphate transferase
MNYRNYWKYVIDFIFSLILLFIFIPFLSTVALGIKISSRGPIFFLQERVGRHGKIFTIYKFRTMHLDTQRKIIQTYNSDPSVFFFGKILRRLKIDELPQIFNILRGDMSWVGPRPCLEETLLEMPEWAKKRFIVKPGITGMAQISGNVSLTWVERWEHDVRYVNNVSLMTDIKLFCTTFFIVLLGEERFKVKV